MIFLCSNTLNLETIELPSWVGWGEALCAVYAHSGLGTEAILPMVCANLASFLFGIRYPISFPRNSSTCPPRYGDRRWVTVKYLSPKWLIFGFFCLFFFFHFWPGNVLCCRSSWLQNSWQLPKYRYIGSREGVPR